MTESESQNDFEELPSYWKSVGVAGVLFAVIAIVVKILLTLWRFKAYSSGSYHIVDIVLGTIILVWLIKAFGGAFACWYYNRQYSKKMQVGRAAMVGFLTGVAITVAGIIINLIWHLIDPTMLHRRMQNAIAIVKSMNLPHGQKKQIIQSVKHSFKNQGNIGQNLFAGIFIYGIPNIITGMIGAKIFDRNKKADVNHEEIRE